MSAKHVSVSNLTRIPARCRAVHQRRTVFVPRSFSTSNVQKQDGNNEKKDDPSSQNEPQQESAMARRLSEMTEDAILEGGRSARKNIQEAGFSEDLKAKLEERLAGSTFRNEYAAAHSIVDMPVCRLRPRKLSRTIAHWFLGKRRTRNPRHRRIHALVWNRGDPRHHSSNVRRRKTEADTYSL